MSIEYTKEAIDRIRSLAREGWPHGAIAAMMGWDIGQLMRTAERHEISFVKIIAKSKTPDPKKARIYWDGRCAWHGGKHVYLSPPEGRMFNAILNADEESEWNIKKMAAAAEVPAKNISAHMSQLRDKLERIGLTVTRRSYELERL